MKKKLVDKTFHSNSFRLRINKDIKNKNNNT